MRERAALVLEEAKRSVNMAAIMTIIFFFRFLFLEVNSVSYCTVKKEHTLSRHWKTGNLWSHKSNKLEKNLVCEEENEVLTLALGFLNYFFFKLFLQLYVNRLIISKKNNPQLPNKVDISFSAKLHRNTD